MKYLFLFFVIFFMSCSSDFRAELCTKESQSLPERYAGVYELSLPQKNLDNSYDIEKLEFNLEVDGISLKMPDFA